jgi:hypothetical protein
MRKLILIGATVIGATVLSASPFSVRWSVGRLSPQHKLSVSFDTANAVIGRPLTPGSVAGIHRRAYRRGAYGGGYYGRGVGVAAAGVIGAGAYGSHQYYNYYQGQGAHSQGQVDYSQGQDAYSQGQGDYYQAQESTTESANSCAARFRSYNAETGMYLGYDGVNHPCP